MLTLMVAIAAASCGAEPPTAALSNRPAHLLAGEWRWVASLDVGSLELHTPATAGYEAVLRFTPAAARSGNYAFSAAGREPVHGAFGIGSEDAPGNDFIVIDRPIDFLQRNAWIAVTRDTLHLGGVMEGGYNSKYVRVRAH